MKIISITLHKIINWCFANLKQLLVICFIFVVIISIVAACSSCQTQKLKYQNKVYAAENEKLKESNKEYAKNNAEHKKIIEIQKIENQKIIDSLNNIIFSLRSEVFKISAERQKIAIENQKYRENNNNLDFILIKLLNFSDVFENQIQRNENITNKLNIFYNNLNNK